MRCLGKEPYPTKRRARHVARLAEARRGTRCHVYRCKTCGQYHITSGKRPKEVLWGDPLARDIERLLREAQQMVQAGGRS